MLDPKPTVYICVELKNREFDAQILLAAEAALKGYRCYVGTHAAIYALLRDKKELAGILLDKSTQPYELMKWEKTKCQSLFVLDAELSPILTLEDLEGEVPGRIYPGTDDLVDRFLCVGPAVYSVAMAHFGPGNRTVVKSGWPRIDIWREHGQEIYAKEATEINKRFGDFLLFVSSFGDLKDPESVKHLKSAGMIKVTPRASMEIRRQGFFNFQKAVKILLEWDANPEVPTIVVRPHTSEDNRVWRRVLKGAKKTFVVAEGEITPWVLASSGVIHQGSSTALHAKFASKPVYFMAEASLFPNQGIAFSASEYLVGVSNPPTKKTFESSPTRNPDYRKAILEEVAYFDVKGSSARIIEEFNSVEATKEMPVVRSKLWISQLSVRSSRRALGLLRDEIQWLRKKTNIYPQSHAVPMGLRRSDVLRVLSAKNDFREVKVRRITINLWEIS